MKLRFLSLLLCVAIVAPVALTPALAQTAARRKTRAKPFLHALFSDDAVLQRDRVIPVWGWTTPGQTVTVQLDDKTTTARADASGRWTARIGPYPAGGPHTLSVSDAQSRRFRHAQKHSVWRCLALFGAVEYGIWRRQFDQCRCGNRCAPITPTFGFLPCPNAWPRRRQQTSIASGWNAIRPISSRARGMVFRPSLTSSGAN